MTTLKYVFWRMDGTYEFKRHAFVEGIGVPIVVPAYVENLTILQGIPAGEYAVLPVDTFSDLEVEDVFHMARTNRDMFRLLTRPIDPWIFALHRRAKRILGIADDVPLESGVAFLALKEGKFANDQDWPELPEDLELAWSGLNRHAAMTLALEMVCPVREMHELGLYSCGKTVDDFHDVDQAEWLAYACTPYSDVAKLLIPELVSRPSEVGHQEPAIEEVAAAAKTFLFGWAKQIRRQLRDAP